MFTGIVEEVGTVKNISYGNMSIKLTITCTRVTEDIKQGDSISVNGICLTASTTGKDWFTADVMPETMRSTSLNNLKISDRVNLERALKLSDRLGGHIVSGHIDGTGNIVSSLSEDNAIWLTIETTEELARYIIPKGSVALDGTSLTVANIEDRQFKVSLIPFTAGFTILGSKKTGDKVNIECDVIGKYVEKLLLGSTYKKVQNEKITMDFLGDNGFL